MVTGHELIKLLRKHGWQVDRVNWFTPHHEVARKNTHNTRSQEERYSERNAK
jgi:hypothetical protein